VEELGANPESPAPGEEVVIAWRVALAYDVTLTGLGREWPDQEPQGSVVVLPPGAGHHPFSLVAVGPGGRTEAEYMLVVDGGKEGLPPTIHRFLAEPAETDPGDPVTLSWRFDRATAALIEGGDEVFDVGAEEQGERTVAPEVTTTWTLVAEGPGGTSTETATVTVRNPLIVAFSADRDEIAEGEAVTLSWQTQFADSVTIDPPVGAADLPAASGAVAVTPDPGEHSWTLTASGQGPNATAEVRVLVHARPVIDRFEVLPAEATPGDIVRLFWETRHADSVTIDLPLQETQLDVQEPSEPDGHAIVAEETTTFLITAVGPGGSADAETTLTVHQRPTIDVFVADPPIIPEGQISVLRWDTTHADTVVIEPTVSAEPLQADGAAEVLPAETSTYELTATGPGGEAVSRTTVTVHPPPTVDLFEADLDLVAPGDAVTLSWETTHATAVSLAPPPPLGLPPGQLDGSVTVYPELDTVYTLTATGPGGRHEAQVEVHVHPRPRIGLFEAEPDEVPLGAEITLTWETENADSVAFDPVVDVDPALVDGSVTVAPQETGNYTLTATGPGGQATDTAWIVVHGEPRILSLDANPQQVALGGSSTLTWNVQAALEVWFDPGPEIEPDAFSGEADVLPEQTTTFELHASNGGGVVTREVTVTVVQPPRVVRFEADPAAILLGETSTLSWEVEDAETVEIEEEGGDPLELGDAPAAAGSVDVAPWWTTTWLLWAEGPGGRTQEAVRATVTVTAVTLKLSEVMFDPVGFDREWQWIELYNPTDLEIPLVPYAVGVGVQHWRQSAFQLQGVVEPGGCFVVGGPQRGDGNGSPVYDLEHRISPTMATNTLATNAVGLFYKGYWTIQQCDLTLEPLDAVLFGYTNSTGCAPVPTFLGPDGEPAPVHFQLFVLDGNGQIVHDGNNQRVRRVQEGQSIARVSPDQDEWVVREVPTPGICFETLRLTGLEPAESPNVEGAEVVVRGAGFTDDTSFSFGDVVAACGVERPDRARCTLPARADGPARVDVTAEAGGEQAVLEAAYTFSGLAEDLDWCQIDAPLDPVEVTAGAETDQLQGRIRDGDVTLGEGAGAGLVGQVGYGPDGSDPQQTPGWRWTDGAWIADAENLEGELSDDRYGATLTVDTPGEYDWAWRFSSDGVLWLYCDAPPGHGPERGEAMGEYDPVDAGRLVVAE